MAKSGDKKMANEISHRYDYLPLLRSSPGGFGRSWSYPFAGRKASKVFQSNIKKSTLMRVQKKLHNFEART